MFLSLSAPSLSKFLPLCCQPGLEKQLCGVAGEIFWVQSSRFFCHCLLFSFTLKLQLFPLCVLLSVCLIRLYASLHLSPSLSSYSSARSCLLFAAQINTRALPVPENQVKSIKQMSHSKQIQHEAIAPMIKNTSVRKKINCTTDGTATRRRMCDLSVRTSEPGVHRCGVPAAKRGSLALGTRNTDTQRHLHV